MKLTKGNRYISDFFPIIVCFALIFFYLYFLCVCIHTHCSTRDQRTTRISFLLSPCGSRGWTQVFKLGQHLYLLNHVTGLRCLFFCFCWDGVSGSQGLPWVLYLVEDSFELFMCLFFPSARMTSINHGYIALKLKLDLKDRKQSLEEA